MDSFITPSPSRADAGEGFIELTPRRRKTSSRLFKKHILNKGTLLYPGASGGKVEIDDDFIDKMVQNFNNGVCDIVQVPLADSANRHTEDPDRNLGEVVGIEEQDGKVYALLDIRDEEKANKMGSTYLGASAQLFMDYTDTSTGQKVGPTLGHVCITNRPYVTGLEEYEEIIAASADNKDEVVLLTPKEPHGDSENQTPTEKKEEPRVATLNELLTELSLSHNINVKELQEKAELAAADNVKLTQTVSETREELEGQIASLTSENESLKAQVETETPGESLLVKLSAALVESGTIKLSAGDTVSPDEIIDTIAGIVQNNVELSAKVEEASKASAEATVDGLVKAGKILPTQRDAMLELYLSNKEMFDKLLPETPLVELSAEVGTSVSDSDTNPQESDIDQEIARLTADNGPAVTSGLLD